MKRGATVLNFVLIIGMLFVGIVVMLNLQKISLFQSKQLEYDTATKLAEEIRMVIEKAEAYPTDLKATITMPFYRQYEFSISNGKIDIYFPREDVRIVEPFSTSNLNVLPSSFSNSGQIFIYTKQRNFLVTDKITCNTQDKICDAGCAYNGICDPVCYSPYIRDVCNPYCVDQNDDQVTNADDADGICDPDCYNTHRNGGYYDIDCIQSNDNICDADTNNLVDNICDADCKKRNGICDPDCGKEDLDC